MVDQDGSIYFGSNRSRYIYKVNASDASLPVSNLVAPTSGNVVGRMANYGSYVYGVTDTGRLVKRNKNGSTTGNFELKASANTLSVPAVLSDGIIYVGSGNTLKKVSSTGVVLATSPDLGGLVGSPSIPGTDVVWVNAGNRLLCLDSALGIVRANYETGGTVGNPATRGNATVITAGSQIRVLGATSLQPVRDWSIDGVVDNSPTTTASGEFLVVTSTHKLYRGNIFSAEPLTVTQLPGTGPITGSIISGTSWIAVAGGSDNNVYLVNRSTGAVTFIGVNQNTCGCVRDLAGHIYFTSEDGCLYGIE